jgi:hypothetical protein
MHRLALSNMKTKKPVLRPGSKRVKITLKTSTVGQAFDPFPHLGVVGEKFNFTLNVIRNVIDVNKEQERP